jgi:hypothetical protein
MQTSIEQQLEDLKSWNRRQLLTEWKKLFGLQAPKSISKSLMIRAISYRWQEKIYGGLSAADQKLLDRLAAAFEKNPSNFQPQLQIKTGTRLRRLYQGKVHEVTTAQNGFLYDGDRYRSLSEIARVITGTRWNGLVFFGLKGPKNPKSTSGGEHDKAAA